MKAWPALNNPSVAMSFANCDALRIDAITAKVRSPKAMPTSSPTVSATTLGTPS